MASALVQLDPDGTAKGTPGVLNYNVPDAISYPGRHFIAFDFPHSMFHTLLSDSKFSIAKFKIDFGRYAIEINDVKIAFLLWTFFFRNIAFQITLLNKTHQVFISLN